MAVPASTLHAYVGLSEVARGKILSMNLDKVRSAPGVVDILTLDDVPGHTDIGPVFPGDPLMVHDQVEFFGQVLFAVAATSYDAARKAARLAIVEYETEAGDFTIEQGLANNSFVRPSHAQQCGDVNAALSAAPHTLEGEMQIGGQEQLYLEGQASLCIPQEDGGMLVYTSNQNPSEAQKLVAEVLNISLNRVTVDMRRMGGGSDHRATQSPNKRGSAISATATPSRSANTIVDDISYPLSSRSRRRGAGTPISHQKTPVAPAPSKMTPVTFSRGPSHGTATSRGTRSSKDTKSTRSTQDSEFASVWRKEELKYWGNVAEKEKKSGFTMKNASGKSFAKSRRRSRCSSQSTKQDVTVTTAGSSSYSNHSSQFDRQQRPHDVIHFDTKDLVGSPEIFNRHSELAEI